MNRPNRNRCLLRAIAIFALAAALRAAAPGTIAFQADQYRDVTAARRILAGEPLLEGPMVAGFREAHLGPLHFYVVAAGLAWRDRPVDAYRLLVLLNAAGAAGFYLVMRRMIGERAGLAAGVVLALYPLALVSERALWNPTLVLPTVTLFLAGLWGWTGEKRDGGLGLLLVGAALMIQTHLSTVCLLPLVLLGRRRLAAIRNRGALLGAGLAAAVTLPWLLPVVSKMFVPRPFLHDFLGHAGRAGAPYPSVSYAQALLATLAPDPLLDRLVVAGSDRWDLVVTLAGWILVVLIAAGVVRVWQLGPARAPARSILIWGGLVMPFLLATLPFLYLHYLDVTFPFRVALAVLGVDLLARRMSRSLAAGILVLALGTGVVHWARTVVESDRTAILRRDLDYFDLFRVPRRDPLPALYPTLGAMKDVGRILSVDLGLTPESLAEHARGPWWPSFLADVGFWMEEPVRHGRARSAPLDAGVPFLIRHRDDPLPSPSPLQRRATYGAGPFTVITLNTALDPDSLEFHLPEHNRPGDWIPCRPAVTGRTIPDLPFGRVRFRLRLVLPEPPPERIYLVLQRPEAQPAFDRVLGDGTDLERAGTWRLRAQFIVDWHRWERPGAGEHHVELHVDRPEAEKVTISLDAIDVWSAP